MTQIYPDEFVGELERLQHDLEFITCRLNKLKAKGCCCPDLEARLELLKSNVTTILCLLDRSLTRPLNAIH